MKKALVITAIIVALIASVGGGLWWKAREDYLTAKATEIML